MGILRERWWSFWPFCIDIEQLCRYTVAQCVWKGFKWCGLFSFCYTLVVDELLRYFVKNEYSDGRFCEKCTENSFKFFASFFLGRFCKTKARIEFWVQNFGKLCITQFTNILGPKRK